MASIKFLVRGKRNPSKITLRLIVDKTTDYRKTIPVLVNPSYFDNSTGKVKRLAKFTEKDTIINTLTDLQQKVIKEYNNTVTKGGFISSSWLEDVVNAHFNLVAVTDLTLLVNFCTHYTEKLRLKTNDKTGGLGSSERTIQKYTVIKKKIEGYQRHTRKTYRLTDVNLKFRDSFLKYLLEVENLGRNTAGRYLKFLKTICLDAKRSGYTMHNELEQIKGFKVDTKKIYLTKTELEAIENKTFQCEKLEATKDWLLIGCYIGQRAGDLLQLTKKNITSTRGLDFIDLVQEKTKKKVSIVVMPAVKRILDKRNGDFPPTFAPKISSSKTMFNRYIKEVCKQIGFTDIIEGAKNNPKTNRKESGEFHKYELVTSHICRRSFATNYYGDIPTPLLMNITAHATEREFLNYIGKTPIDFAEQMAVYWDMLAQRESSRENAINGVEPSLKVAK